MNVGTTGCTQRPVAPLQAPQGTPQSASTRHVWPQGDAHVLFAMQREQGSSDKPHVTVALQNALQLAAASVAQCTRTQQKTISRAVISHAVLAMVMYESSVQYQRDVEHTMLTTR